jgi:RNA polymerase sigma-70 factor (ECF subfamily)
MGCPAPLQLSERRVVFAGIFRQNRDAVLRLSMRLTRHPQDAEDLCQETFLRGWRMFGQLDDTDSARPWLLRIATNAFIGIYRRARRRDEPVWAYDEVVARADSMVSGTAVEAPDPIRVHGEVLAAVESLPVAFREAVTLVDLGDAEYAEAAGILRVPVGTVMSRLHRGRSILRSRLSVYARESGLLAA